MEPIIAIQGLGKCYKIYSNPLHRFLRPLGLSRGCIRELWAVRHVDLTVPRGSCFGIIGPNGAGKSTLLKILSGVSKPTEGSMNIQGSVSSILELGVGFHPDFSGRNNVYLNCALHGFTHDETTRKMDEIVGFAELEDFIDLPVRTYSTGMTLRLGFSIATAVDPDILIVDEALSVGDEHFRNKSLDRMNQFKKQGKTVILVSHDLATVRNFCSEVALLDRGCIQACGRPEDVLDRYLQMVHRDKSIAQAAADSTPRWGTGEVHIRTVSMKNESLQETRVFDTYEPLQVDIEFDVEKPVDGAVFGCLIHRMDGTYINGSNHHWHQQAKLLHFERAGERHTIRCRIPRFPLLRGDYYLTVCCYNHNMPFPQAIDHWERAAVFSVSERMTDQHGLMALETEWELLDRSDLP